MTSSMVTFNGNGQSFSGYLASPDKPGPAVIVIQEWWGLVDHIQDICNRFAAAGFNALAPDFYHGKKTKSPDDAGKLMMALDIDNAAKVIQGAVDFLLEHESSHSKMAGVVGFCMGGQLSMFAAASYPTRFNACVNFYGIHPDVHPPFDQLTAPILGFFASRDAMVGPTVVSALEDRLNGLGKDVEFHTYEADHAFFNDTRPEVFNPEASEECWSKMLAFFRTHIT